MAPSGLPFLAWPRPQGPQIRADLIAGASVAVVAIPQSLAYAQLAGLPPHLGLYAAFVPTIVAALFGSSAQLSTGPVALTSLLTAASLAALAEPGTAPYLTLAVLLALGSGLLQLLAGVIGLGRFIERIPAALMLGFVNAAALVIVFSQLPALLGVPAARGSGPIAAFSGLLQNSAQGVPATAAFGVVSLALLLLARRYCPTWPAALFVSGAAILVSWAIGYQQYGSVVGDLPPGLPALAWPTIDPVSVSQLMSGMVLIALVSFIEVTSSARTIAARTGTVWNVNQELVGQGLAKIAASLFAAFPVSGSFSRSALNLSAGALTAWSSMVCAALVGIALVFATSALHHLPNAVLAALIVSAVLSLLTPLELIKVSRLDRAAGATAWVTLLATLFFAPRIHYGLIVGLGVSAALSALARRR
jgi:sulfate permease, SulP family